jgi:hypothetical protein
MTSQQEAQAALDIYQSNRDDQERMDRMLREFFADVREEERTAEFKRQLECVREEMSCPVTTKQFSSSSAPSLSA